MKYKEHFHRNAGTVIHNIKEYSEEYQDLTSTLLSISDIELVDEYIRIKNNSNKKSEKSLSKAINNLIKERLIKLGWKTEVAIFRDDEYSKDKRLTTWRLDFAKEKMSVEVGFNHGGNIAHNLIKPTLAGELNHVEKEIQTEVAIVISATQNLKKACNFDGAIGTYEKILTYLKPYNQYLTVPIAIIGLEAPETFIIGKDKQVEYLT